MNEESTYCGKPLRTVRWMSAEEKRLELERIKAELERLRQIANTIQTQKMIDQLTEVKRRLEQSYIPPSH